MSHLNVSYNIYDFMLCLQEDQLPGVLFSIDFEEAFYSILLRSFRNDLQLYNFGSSIIQRLDTFYKGATSCYWIYF